MEQSTPMRTPIVELAFFRCPSLGNMSAPKEAPIVWNWALSVDILADKIQSMKTALNHSGIARSINSGIILSISLMASDATTPSVFRKKATKEGALASLWTGALASLFAMLFLHKAEAGAVGLCNMLSGRDVLIDIYPWFAIDPILFALPLSTVAMVLTSLITYKKQEI